MSQSSRPSWLHTFASACLAGRCCSPSTASHLADSQGLTGYLVYPEGLSVQMDPWSIPSDSFHGAHLDITTPPPAVGAHRASHDRSTARGRGSASLRHRHQQVRQGDETYSCRRVPNDTVPSLLEVIVLIETVTVRTAQIRQGGHRRCGSWGRNWRGTRCQRSHRPHSSSAAGHHGDGDDQETGCHRSPWGSSSRQLGMLRALVRSRSAVSTHPAPSAFSVPTRQGGRTSCPAPSGLEASLRDGGFSPVEETFCPATTRCEDWPHVQAATAALASLRLSPALSGRHRPCVWDQWRTTLAPEMAPMHRTSPHTGIAHPPWCPRQDDEGGEGSRSPGLPLRRPLHLPAATREQRCPTNR